jgi:phosphatidylserine decarboxylase
MKIDRAGIPFVAVAAIVSLALAGFRLPVPAAALFLLAVALAAFFRDPERHPPSGRDLVLSPADGRVMVAGPSADGAAPSGKWYSKGVENPTAPSADEMPEPVALGALTMSKR